VTLLFVSSLHGVSHLQPYRFYGTIYYLFMCCVTLAPLSIVCESVVTSIMDTMGARRWQYRVATAVAVVVGMFAWSLTSTSSVRARAHAAVHEHKLCR
jgi:hypothetical protein